VKIAAFARVRKVSEKCLVKVGKRCGLQFVLVAERFGLKTIFRLRNALVERLRIPSKISRRKQSFKPLSAADKFGRARTLKYYRKPLLYGAKGSKIKGRTKDCFPFASVIGSWLPALTFPAGHSGQPTPFLNSK
jgi:hypothetical protein